MEWQIAPIIKKSHLAEAIKELEQTRANSLRTPECLSGNQACLDSTNHPSVFYQIGEAYYKRYINGQTYSNTPEELLAIAAAHFLKADWLQKHGPKKFDQSQEEPIRQYKDLQIHLKEIPDKLLPNDRQYFLLCIKNNYACLDNNQVAYEGV